ncbi:MAG: taurine dioxygenase [Balneolaceae bacterium]
MNDTEFKRVDIKLVSDMLYGEEKYVNEFAIASIDSFSEFSEHYALYLMQRDMENLRKTGHKIKPVAQMLKVDEILNEYDQAKLMLINNASDEKLQQSVDTVTSICDEVLNDFKKMAEMTKE